MSNCKYCNKEETIFEISTISPNTAYFVGGIKEGEIDSLSYDLCLFIDSRGYLRLVDADDCNCLDSGEKIKINFCPICGGDIFKY